MVYAADGITLFQNSTVYVVILLLGPKIYFPITDVSNFIVLLGYMIQGAGLLTP